MAGLLLWVCSRGVLVAVDVLVAVQEGDVGEGITAPLHLVGLWGGEMLSDSTDAHS